MACSALHVGRQAVDTEAGCLPGWRGLDGRSLLGSESRMTKWDAGKLALEGQVKGTRTRF